MPILGFRTTGCELSSWSADVRCEARTHLVGEENRDLALLPPWDGRCDLLP